jgi:hypothetical protein
VQPSYTLLFLEILFLGVTLAIWFARRREENRGLGLGGGPVSAASAPSRTNRRPCGRTNDALREVPIPWGWPNCVDYRGKRNKRSASESLHYLADVLFTEKQLVSNAVVNPRIVNSIRALIEDRYRPVDRDQQLVVELPAHVDEDIWYVGPVAETRAVADRQYRSNLHEVRELRAPWGW